MKSELDTTWTMVMSWTPVNPRLSALFKIPFTYNSPQTEDALNWDLYRLRLARMRFLQTHSTHWRATCSYPTHGIDFEITSVEISRTLTSLISLENASARKWNTSTSGKLGYGSDGAFLAEAKYMDIAYRQYPHPLSRVQDGDIWCGIKWRQLLLVRRPHQQQIPLHTGRPIHYPVVVWSSPLISV